MIVPAMNIRISHRVVLARKTHRFVVIVECPVPPHKDFMFVFRDSRPDGDDCALIVEDVQGWDATNQHLLVKTFDWNVDEWAAANGNNADQLFQDAREQLIRVARCEHLPPK